MYEANSDRVTYIKEIQSMLRDYRFWSLGIADIGIDGNYDNGTRAGIVQFQKRFGLEPDGVVDFTTWVTLNRVHAVYGQFYEAGESIDPFPYISGETVSKGEESDIVFIIQLMLNALSLKFDGFTGLELTGVFDDATENAVKSFQESADIPVNGIVNRPTWNLLVKSYNYISKENQ